MELRDAPDQDLENGESDRIVAVDWYISEEALKIWWPLVDRDES